MGVPTGPGRMRISQAGRATEPRGFTLIELLVVVTILSVLALGVGLRAGSGLGSARTAQALLIDDLAWAREQAILSRQVMGVLPTPDGWRVMQRGAQGWVAAPVPPRRAASARWMVGVPPVAVGLGAAVPAILLLPQGQGSAFSVMVDGALCRSDGWGPVSCG